MAAEGMLDHLDPVENMTGHGELGRILSERIHGLKRSHIAAEERAKLAEAMHSRGVDTDVTESLRQVQGALEVSKAEALTFQAQKQEAEKKVIALEALLKQALKNGPASAMMQQTRSSAGEITNGLTKPTRHVEEQELGRVLSEKLHRLGRSHVAALERSTLAEAESRRLLDLLAASEEKLMRLPGLGEAGYKMPVEEGTGEQTLALVKDLQNRASRAQAGWIDMEIARNRLVMLLEQSKEQVAQVTMEKRDALRRLAAAENRLQSAGKCTPESIAAVAEEAEAPAACTSNGVQESAQHQEMLRVLSERIHQQRRGHMAAEEQCRQAEARLVEMEGERSQIATMLATAEQKVASLAVEMEEAARELSSVQRELQALKALPSVIESKVDIVGEVKEEVVVQGVVINGALGAEVEMAMVQKIHVLRMRQMAAEERCRHVEACMAMTANVSDAQLANVAYELKQVEASLADAMGAAQKLAKEKAEATKAITDLESRLELQAMGNKEVTGVLDAAPDAEKKAVAGGGQAGSESIQSEAEERAELAERKMAEMVEERKVMEESLRRAKEEVAAKVERGEREVKSVTGAMSRQADAGADTDAMSLLRKQLNTAIQREREEAKLELGALHQRYEGCERSLAVAHKELSMAKAAVSGEGVDERTGGSRDQEKETLAAEVAKLKEALRVSWEEREEVDVQSRGIKERIKAFEVAKLAGSPTATKERVAAAEKIAGLQARLAAVDGELARAKKGGEAMQGEVNLLSKEREQLKGEAEKRDREVKQLDVRLGQVKKEGEERVRSGEKEAENLRAQVVMMHQTAGEEVKKLKSEAQRVIGEKDIVAAKLKGVGEKLSLMAAAEQQYVAELKGSRAALERRVKEFEVLERRVGEVQEARVMVEVVLRQKETEVASLRQQLTALTHAQELRDEEIHRLSQVAAEEESQLARLSKELQNVVSERREQEEMLGQEQQRVQQHLRSVASKQEEVKKLHTVLAAQEQEGERRLTQQKQSLEAKQEQLVSQWREADRVGKKAGREVEEVKRNLERRIGLANAEAVRVRQVAEQEKAQRVKDKVTQQEKLRGVVKEATEIRRSLTALTDEVADLRESASPETLRCQLARVAALMGSSRGGVPLLNSLHRFWQGRQVEPLVPQEGGGGETNASEGQQAVVKSKGGKRRGKRGGGGRLGGKGEPSLKALKAAQQQAAAEEEQWEGLIPANRALPGWLSGLQLVDLAKVAAGGALAIIVQRLAVGLM